MKPVEALLMIRQGIIKFYKQYEYIFEPLLKFMSIFIALHMLVVQTGYQGALSGLLATLMLTVIATFLPPKELILGTILMVTVFLISTNPVLGIVVFSLLAILYILFMRLFPRESLLIIAVLIAFHFKIGVLVPFVAALFGSYIGSAAIILGTFIWYVIPELVLAIEPTQLVKSEVIESLQSLGSLEGQTILADPTMLCTMVIFFVVFSIIYIIRKQNIDYANYVALGIGAVMNIAGFGLAILFLKIDISMTHVVVVTLLAVLITAVILFFSKILDYERAEAVQFEDEDNYYFVKVVPKVYLTTNPKKVKRIYNAKAGNAETIETINKTES